MSPGLSKEEGKSYISIARIGRTRGNRGEVTVEDWCEDDARFAAGAEYSLLRPDKTRMPATLEKSWRHQSRLILKFKGVDTISEAEQLRNFEVQIRQTELGPPPEGEHYFRDLIGCEVVDAEDGRLIGQVESVQEAGGAALLELRSGKHEVLVPFNPAICEIVDVEKKRITARMPEGLEDLNS